MPKRASSLTRAPSWAWESPPTVLLFNPLLLYSFGAYFIFGRCGFALRYDSIVNIHGPATWQAQTLEKIDHVLLLFEGWRFSQCYSYLGHTSEILPREKANHWVSGSENYTQAPTYRVNNQALEMADESWNLGAVTASDLCSSKYCSPLVRSNIRASKAYVWALEKMRKGVPIHLARGILLD